MYSIVLLCIFSRKINLDMYFVNFLSLESSEKMSTLFLSSLLSLATQDLSIQDFLLRQGIH